MQGSDSHMQTLEVSLGERSYPIFIGPDILDDISLLSPYIAGRQVMVVTNSTIAPLYLQRLLATLSAYQLSSLVLPDGEQYKTLEVLNRIYDALLSEGHNRSTTLLALGGGVIGDMVGFAAASYQRGVNFIQIPTTLLSQVDSSVGGKTGVNHALGKNMIGAFHQPRCVLADTNTLKTLPDKELSAGIAEVIKYGLITDMDFFSWLETNMPALLAREQEALAHAIRKSCECKARIVAADEREGGIRAILNLGHTFAHAIETHQGYGRWLHGEAVATGMLMAARLSEKMGWITTIDRERLHKLLLAARLPVAAPSDMGVEDFLRLMKVDKKVIDGQLRLVLLKPAGKAVITTEAPPEQLQEVIREFTGA